VIGETTIIGADVYMMVNDRGTLEKLPPMRPLPMLWLWVITRNGAHLEVVREFAARYRYQPRRPSVWRRLRRR